MKPLRWVAGGLVWLLAGLLATVGVLLSVTIILLPLGIPVLMLARRLFVVSVRLVLPRPVAHPVRRLQKRTLDTGTRAIDRGRHALALPELGGRRTRRKRMARRIRRARQRLRTA